MRHHRRNSKFGRDASHRLAMFRNLVTSLFLKERVLTTLPKAKELRRVAERLITLGKRGDLAARRLAAEQLRTTGKTIENRRVNEPEALRKLFGELAPRFKDRQGGYTRIIKTGNRVGDCAPMAFIELLPDEKKAAATKGEKKDKVTGKEKIAKATKAAAKPRAAKSAKPAAKAKSPKAKKGAEKSEE
jgi:large subunit ribosomal protein L17